RRIRRSTATGAGSFRSCTAGRTTTASPARAGTSSRRTSRRRKRKRRHSPRRADAMLTALTIAMLTGITVWWLLVQRLKAKPWAEQGVIPGSQDGLTSSAPKVGLWVFLAMVTSLFLVFVGAYVMRKNHGHGGGMHEWVPVDDPSVLWIN